MKQQDLRKSYENDWVCPGDGGYSVTSGKFMLIYLIWLTLLLEISWRNISCIAAPAWATSCTLTCCFQLLWHAFCPVVRGLSVGIVCTS